MMSEAGQLSARIVIENSTNRPRIEWVEPWARITRFSRRKGSKIIARVTRNRLGSMWSSMTREDGRYGSKVATTTDVVQNGIKLECGHQRQAGLDAGLQF